MTEPTASVFRDRRSPSAGPSPLPQAPTLSTTAIRICSYVLLPVWQAEFGLGYAEVGMLRGSYMATMSALQIPASLLAERISPMIVLVTGTLLAACCFLLAGISTVVGLLVALLLGGVGASVQHPKGQM